MTCVSNFGIIKYGHNTLLSIVTHLVGSTFLDAVNFCYCVHTVLICKKITFRKCDYRYRQELIMWRGEYLTLYSPVIDDCAQVKWLPFCVT